MLNHPSTKDTSIKRLLVPMVSIIEGLHHSSDCTIVMTDYTVEKCACVHVQYSLSIVILSELQKILHCIINIPLSPDSVSGSVSFIRSTANRITLNVPATFTSTTCLNDSSGCGPFLETVFTAMAIPKKAHYSQTCESILRSTL